MNEPHSPSYLRSHFNYDPATGVLTYLAVDGDSRRCLIGKRAGAVSVDRNGYARAHITISHKKYMASRVIWAWMMGSWPDGLIDHKDGNSLNNKWENLRICTASENTFNARAQKNSATGIKGVCYKKRVNRFCGPDICQRETDSPRYVRVA